MRRLTRGGSRALIVVVVLALATACGAPGSGGDAEGGDAAVRQDGSSDGPEGALTAVPADSVPGSVEDAAGRTITFTEPVRRIVSLVPSATQTLLALGARGRLVGRTDFDRDSAVADLPSVGGGIDPSMEVLVSLDPDLVLRFAGQTDRSLTARLDGLGIPHFAVRPERVADVRAMIEGLGRVVGRDARADSILARLEGAFESIRERVRGRERRDVIYVLGGSPPYVAGEETFVHELIELGGGRNVFDDLGRPWAGVSPETILSRDPELFLTSEDAELDPRIADGAAVRRLSPLVQLPGPRLDEAALEVARALHPDAFR